MNDKFLDDTIVRARELGEVYTDTTAGQMLDAQRLRVEHASREDPELVSILVLELAKNCTQVEQYCEE